LGSNPTLAAAAARVRAARARQIQAGRFPNPVVGYHATEIGNQGTAGQQGGFISQRFITGGKLPLDQAVAGAQVDEALYGLRSQEQRVLNDVRVSYYNALVAQRRVDSQCRPDGERPAPQRHRRRRGQRTGRRADTDI
jgi:outer membrane protein TolC